MATILGTSLLLTGCDQPANNAADKPKVEILADKVIVDNSLIQTSNPERYQPSYNLEGALIPVDIADIKTPYRADNFSLAVKEGDWVKKGQVIATLQTRIDANTARYTHFDSIDALIEGNDLPLAQQYAVQDKPSETIATNNKEAPSKSLPKLDLNASDKRAAQSKANKTSNNTDSDNTAKNDTSANPDSDNKKSEDLIEVTLVFRAPIDGEVTQINKDIKQALMAQGELNVEADVIEYDVPANTSLMTIGNTQRLQLIGKLPLSTQSQLSVGRSVNFTVFDVNTEFTGQISHITPDVEAGYLIVRAPLISSDENKAALEPGMRAAMSIDYGQTELGVRLPKQAIHEADLDVLNAKHNRPTSPIKGFVWVIEQDQRLSYTPVEVIQYFGDSDKYLVHGINNDSLVCLADLPKDSAGKLISVD